jgi:hypothetical protein
MHTDTKKNHIPPLSASELALLVLQNSGDYAVLTVDLHKVITN